MKTNNDAKNWKESYFLALMNFVKINNIQNNLNQKEDKDIYYWSKRFLDKIPKLTLKEISRITIIDLFSKNKKLKKVFPLDSKNQSKILYSMLDMHRNLIEYLEGDKKTTRNISPPPEAYMESNGITPSQESYAIIMS